MQQGKIVNVAAQAPVYGLETLRNRELAGAEELKPHVATFPERGDETQALQQQAAIDPWESIEVVWDGEHEEEIQKVGRSPVDLPTVPFSLKSLSKA
jgi:hypothetical protein